MSVFGTLLTQCALVVTKMYEFNMSHDMTSQGDFIYALSNHLSLSNGCFFLSYDHFRRKYSNFTDQIVRLRHI